MDLQLQNDINNNNYISTNNGDGISSPDQRAIIGELELYEKESWRKIWLELELRERILNFYNNSKDRSPFLQLSSSLARIESKGVLDPSTDNLHKQCFAIVVFGTTYTLRASSKQERKKWVNQLNSAKTHTKSKQRRSLGSSSSGSDEDSDTVNLRTIDDFKQIRMVEANEDSDTKHQLDIFSMLPDETMYKIWGFLDAKSIGHAASVCQRFKKMSYDVPLWKERATKENWDSNRAPYSHQRSLPDIVTRSYYVKKFLSFQQREKDAAASRLTELKNRLKQRDQENSGRILLATCFARPYEWLMALTVLWITIMAVLKLDETIDWEWKYILIPLYIVVLQLMCAPVCYDAISSKFSYTFEDELDPDDNHLCGPIFFFLAFIVPLNNLTHRGIRRLRLFPITFGLALFLIFAMIRVAGAEGMKWWAVFIPLNIAILWVMLLVLFAGYDSCFSDDAKMDRILISIGLLLVVLFFIFLGLRMEDVITWRWILVMTPLFILKGLAVVIPTILSICTYYCDARGSYWLEDRTRWANHAGSYCMGVLGIAILLLGPLLTFEVLLAQRLDETIDTSYKLIFIPLFIIEGFGICGCCIVNCAFLCS